MASTVTTYSDLINISYPTPGADNDLKGFHDNFSNIKSALSLLSNEITTLQDTGVLITTDNDFGDNTVTNAVIVNSTIILKSFDLT